MTTRPTLEVLATRDAAIARAAAIVREAVRLKPDLVLGLATGATMVPLYERLAAAVREGAVSFAGASAFNLDEYAGLAPDDPNTFRAYTRRHVIGPLELPPSRARLPDGAAPDRAAEARRYEALVAAAGGIDLQLLGLGANGHIAFNEPGSPFDSRTREVALAPQTRAAAAADFEGEPPERAITMGIGTILEARAILLVATGPGKARALAAALEGPVTEACPASALRGHPRVRVVCDRAAAAELQDVDGRER